VNAALRNALLAMGVLLLGACATTPESLHLPAQARSQSARQIVVTIRDNPAALSVAPGATAGLPMAGPGYGGSSFAQRVAREIARDYALRRVAAWYIDALHVHCVVYSLEDEPQRDALIERLRADVRVESAQRMQSFRTTAEPAGAKSYNDPYFPLQRAVDAISVPAAQQLSLGRGVRIAVIDTGVDTAHPDLRGRMEASINVVDSDAAQFALDRHGTAVAGAIGAVANNGLGIIGVAPQVRLLAIKACWETAADGAATCSSLSLAAGLALAIQQRVQIVNLSFTGPSDPLLERLVARAVAAGIVVVAADMRRTTGAPVDAFPLKVRGVVAVANADQVSTRDDRALCAPGHAILTLVPGGRYDYVSGTSMSVALASGVAALVLERRLPHAQGGELAALLRDTADARSSGALINARAAVGARAAAALAQRQGWPRGKRRS
jgi:subtilisin family serine protease